MDLTLAAALATTLSYVVFLLGAVWYVAPRIGLLSKENAITALLWVHVFRHVALQLFSAKAAGFDISDAARDQIVYGDLVGMILAVSSIVLLRYRGRYGLALVWVFVVATVIDLTNAAVAGVSEQLFEQATDVSWLILTFYVPLLWVSLGLIVWQLVARRKEPTTG